MQAVRPYVSVPYAGWQPQAQAQAQGHGHAATIYPGLPNLPNPPTYPPSYPVHSVQPAHSTSTSTHSPSPPPPLPQHSHMHFQYLQPGQPPQHHQYSPRLVNAPQNHPTFPRRSMSMNSTASVPSLSHGLSLSPQQESDVQELYDNGVAQNLVNLQPIVSHTDDLTPINEAMNNGLVDDMVDDPPPPPPEEMETVQAPTTFHYFRQHYELISSPIEEATLPSTVRPVNGSPLMVSTLDVKHEDEHGWLNSEGTNNDLLQPGAAIGAMAYFTECLEGMAGGSFTEWTDLFQEQFGEKARFQLNLCSASGIKMFDIYATSLARFFATLNPNLRSCSLTLPSPIETIVLASSPSSTASSPPSSSLPRHGIELSCADATWRWGLDGGDDSDGAPVEVTWSCVVTTTWVPLAEEGVLRMEKMEIVVEGIKGGGWEWGMPEEAIRVLEISQQVEDMMDVMTLAAMSGKAPREALESLTIELVEEIKLEPEDVGIGSDEKTNAGVNVTTLQTRDEEGTTRGVVGDGNEVDVGGGGHHSHGLDNAGRDPDGRGHNHDHDHGDEEME